MIKIKGQVFKNQLYTFLYRIFVILLLIFLGFSVIFFMIKYSNTKSKMENDIVQIFEEAIEEDLNTKMKKEHSAIQLFNEPTDKYINTVRTIITKDTIIKEKVQVTNQKKHVYNSFITYLKIKNRLETDTLSYIFHNVLIDNDIYVTSFVLLEYDKTTIISGDTTNYVISFKTPTLRQGFEDEISFQGLVYYTPLSVLKLMPKYLLYIFIATLFLLTFILLYLRKENNKIRPNKIMKLKSGDYYIGCVYYSREKRTLENNNNLVTITAQLARIFEMFLESDDFTVNKEELQEKLWPSSTSSYNNMTSTINRLRNAMKQVDATFDIITLKGSDFYKMVYDEKEE